MPRSFKFFAVVTGLGISSASAQAQEQQPPALCKTKTCSIQVDWGVAGPPLTTDRRYGPIAEYLQRIVSNLETAGHRFVGEKQDNDVLTFRLRPHVVRAMCDEMSGTSTDMSCQMIGETEVEVRNPDPSIKNCRSLFVYEKWIAVEFGDLRNIFHHCAHAK